jgi:hypothetical protein
VSRFVRRPTELAALIGEVESDAKSTDGCQVILLEIPSEHAPARRNFLDLDRKTVAGPVAAISRLSKSQAVSPGVQCRHSPAQGD